MNNTIQIPIEENFAGHYRLEYDGKYITLYGWDKQYPAMFSEEEFDEMVLIPVVIEIRNASPKITEITDTVIIIELFP